MKRPPTSTGTPSPASVRRGEKIARPLAKPGRIRRETLTVEYTPSRKVPDSETAETQTITPGDTFRRYKPNRADSVYMYVGTSAEDPDCMYLYELGRDRVPVGYGCVELIRKQNWITDYENGHSWYWRIPLEEAIGHAYADAGRASSGLLSRILP